MAYDPYSPGWDPCTVGRQTPKYLILKNKSTLLQVYLVNSNKLNNLIQEGYRQLFSRHKFDIMVTLRFEHKSYRYRDVSKHLKEFARELAKSRKDQVAGYFIFNALKHPHAHLILFGKKKHLGDVTTSTAETLWKYGSAHACEATDDGVSFYAALNITPHAQELYSVIPYNLRLLKKKQTSHKDKMPLNQIGG